MKHILIILCCLMMVRDVYSQDTARIDTNRATLSIQPFVGLGLFNGGRIGLSAKLNELVALEVGYGLDVRASLAIILFFIPFSNDGRTLSEGIIITPFKEKRLSLILYNTYNFRTVGSSSMMVWQAMVGWKIDTGESTALRMCAGYAQKYEGEFPKRQDKNWIGLDFVLTYDAFKVSW